MRMPTLTTERLTVREFELDDLDATAAIHPDLSDAERRQWLTWAVLSYEWLGRLMQPPYTDRAVVRRADGALIGSCGFAPVLAPVGQLPDWRHHDPGVQAEVGLYWSLVESARGQGFATEAGRALLDYGFDVLGLGRIVATTEYANLPSRRVMERLGMRIQHNPSPEPPWFQVLAVLEAADRRR